MAPGQELRILRIVWLAFLGSLVMYAAVLLVLPGGTPAAEELASVLRPFFTLVAVGIGVASFIVKRLALAAPASATAPASTDDAARLRAACIVAWALSEGVAVLGLVLGFLGGRAADFVPYGVVAALLLYLHRPAAWQSGPAGGAAP
jgi:hypothetical protein